MFDIIFKNDIRYNNVLITKENNKIIFSIDETYYLNDDISYINNYCYKLSGLEYNDVLIGGLGLGIIPYYLENFKSINTIDVVENNTDVVLATTTLNHLKKTNIINDDFYFYKANKKYDLIIVDLWWLKPKFFKSRKVDIQNNYKNNLKDGGKIYIPISDEIIYL